MHGMGKSRRTPRVQAQWQVLNVSVFCALRPCVSVTRTSSLCLPRFSFFVLTFSENLSFFRSAMRLPSTSTRTSRSCCEVAWIFAVKVFGEHFPLAGTFFTETFGG